MNGNDGDEANAASVRLPVAVRMELAVAELSKGVRVSGAERSKLAKSFRARYDEGESIRALAESAGRSYGFVHRLLTEDGKPLRRRGGATRRSRAKTS